MVKIKRIACGNDYESKAIIGNEYESVKAALIAATPKNWSIQDWNKVDDDKYKLGETSVYVIIN